MNVRKPGMMAIYKALWVVAVVAGLGLFASAAGVAYAQNAVQKYWSDNYGVSPPAPDGKFYQFSRLAKAQPDECFDSTNLTGSYQSFFLTYPGNLPSGLNPSCVNVVTGNYGVPKTNQAYLWGFTNWGSDLWFGTIANTLCLVAEGMGASGFQMNTIECQGLQQDARPPRIFLYDTKARELKDMTLRVFTSSNPQDKYNLMHTFGLRSAGSIGNIVFLGGLASDPAKGTSGITMFAFNGRTRQFIGSIYYNGVDAPKYTNIRQWLMTENNLYVGVAGATTSPIGFGATSGYILHWIGDVTNPFQFEVVGNLKADPAYLARYQDKLFVMTWGGENPGDYGTVLYMSPSLSTIKKLGPAAAGLWNKIWSYSNYEVEPAAAMGGGALMAHDGWLYWSTMVPPGIQAQAFSKLYPNAPSDYAFLGSYRPTSLFRGKFLDSTGSKMQVQLLYGNANLPKYVESGTTTGCTNTGPTCEWAIAPNNMGQKPLYGLSGYNNFFNSYTWWMQVYNGELFIGTFDWSYLLFESLFDIANNPSTGSGGDWDFGAPSILGTDAATIPDEVIKAARLFEGADLLRIHNSQDPAYVVSLNGVGNFSNYGVRNMLQVGSELFIGTANPFNLLNPPTNVNYDNQLGGWELLHLKPTDAWYQTYCPTTTTTVVPSGCSTPTATTPTTPTP